MRLRVSCYQGHEDMAWREQEEELGDILSPRGAGATGTEMHWSEDPTWDTFPGLEAKVSLLRWTVSWSHRSIWLGFICQRASQQVGKMSHYGFPPPRIVGI